jgi:hypothetical protein
MLRDKLPADGRFAAVGRADRGALSRARLGWTEWEASRRRRWPVAHTSGHLLILLLAGARK